jgi:hypothetical protein
VSRPVSETVSETVSESAKQPTTRSGAGKGRRSAIRRLFALGTVFALRGGYAEAMDAQGRTDVVAKSARTPRPRVPPLWASPPPIRERNALAVRALRRRSADAMTAILEALYRLDLEFEPWSRHVAEALREVLDEDHLGVLGALYDCPDPCSMTMGRLVHCEVLDHLLNLFEEGARALPPEYVADKYLGRSYSFAASLRGWAEIPPVRDGTALAHGVADLLTLSTTELDGAGCAFFVFRGQRRPVSVHDHIELARLGRHLAAARRLRRRLTSDAPATSFAEAILDGGGRVHHACGEARSKPSRAALFRAVRQMERARRRSAHNPDMDRGGARWTRS